VPRFAETGRPGDEAELELRLKLLADAALVGLPNAGKSSLLRRISNAKPKVAEYPFTTLAPVLGTVDAPDGTRQLTVADVPGLIEGASRGVGLGHEFLAHLERARTLLHVIDAAGSDPADAFRAIDRELAAYGAGLDALPQIVVLNKLDLLSEPPELGVEDPRVQAVFRVSAATGEGVDRLKRALFELVEPAAPASAADDEGLVDFLVYRPRPGRPPYRILRTDRGFRVTGSPPEDEELEAALKAAGARTGDEVEIGDEVLELR
jgi:GTP-binding protein